MTNPASAPVAAAATELPATPPPFIWPLVRRIFVFLVALLLGAGWYGQSVYLKPLPRFIQTTSPHSVGIDQVQNVALNEGAGLWGSVRLDCWYIPGTRPETIIAAHGRGDSKTGLLPVLGMLHDAGYSTFALEFRAHGTSEGNWSTIGAAEQRDMEAAIDWVRTQHPAPLALFGYSMGGCVALEVAARDTDILGVATEGAVADQVDEIHQYFAPISRLLIPAAAPWILLRTGSTPWDAQPVKRIGRIAPRPVFLIHSRVDEVIGFQGAQHLYAAAGEPKELWELPDASHIAGVARYPVEFRRRLVAFYDKLFSIDRS